MVDPLEVSTRLQHDGNRVGRRQSRPDPVQADFSYYLRSEADNLV